MLVSNSFVMDDALIWSQENFNKKNEPQEFQFQTLGKSLSHSKKQKQTFFRTRKIDGWRRDLGSFLCLWKYRRRDVLQTICKRGSLRRKQFLIGLFGKCQSITIEWKFQDLWTGINFFSSDVRYTTYLIFTSMYASNIFS